MKAARLGNFALAGLLTALLAGCAGEQVKEAKVPAPAPVLRAVTPAAAPQTAASGPAAAVNPLNDPGNLLSKRSVYFDYDSYSVKPEFPPMIQAHAGYLREHPGASVIIEGNCDERGSREYNLALGQRRAEGVKKMMAVLGVPAKQLESVSFGEEKPKAAGHDESAWSQNRRDDIVYKREQ